MFRFEGFCDDKYVVTIMKALTGLTMDFKMVPVVNAKAKDGKLIAETSGDPVELLATWIKQHKFSEITPKQAMAFMTNIGRKPGGYSHLLSKAKEAKLLKIKPGTTGNKTIYQVMK